MFFQTRLSRYLSEILYQLEEKALTVQKTFSLALFFLFIGFLCGNLFGTFLDTLRLYFFWNGLVGLFLLFFIETINFLVYGFLVQKKMGSLSLYYQNSQVRIKKPKKFFQLIADDMNESVLENRTRFYKKIICLERIVNAFKIGLLFGFFVDSFKVGS